MLYPWSKILFCILGTIYLIPLFNIVVLIKYNRDPDVYRFRIANLPHQLLYPPHSENASPIVLSDGQTGELAKQYHQPKETELHTTLLCKLYSPK
jgi:hypothetical protein